MQIKQDSLKLLKKDSNFMQIKQDSEGAVKRGGLKVYLWKDGGFGARVFWGLD